MKPLNKLALSGLLLLTAHSMSFAATYTLHITGSTAFRAATHNAIVNYLYTQGGNVDPVGAYKGSNISGANQAIFKGPINSGADTLIVETDWTGSAQGIYDTANSNALASAWIDPSNALSTVTHATAPAKVSGGTSIASPVFAAAVAPDATLSDVWQASTLFPTPALTEVVANGVGLQAFVVCASKGAPAPISGVVPLTTTAGSNVVTLDPSVISLLSPGDAVGSTANIPPFAVVTATPTSTPPSAAGTITISVSALATGTSNSLLSYPGFTNITDEQARGLFTNGTGKLPLSNFTGVTTDSGNTVIGIGRSPDSGTRVAFTEEVGVGKETSLSQIAQLFPYDLSNNLVTSSSVQIGSFALTPSVVFNGLTLAVGDNGYSKGSDVATVLDNGTVAANGIYMVSPLGISDATNAVNGGASALTFDGVAYNSVAVETGSYPLWAYEHLYKSASLAGQPLTSATGIANQILASDALLGGDKISSMLVSRHPITVDGATIY